MTTNEHILTIWNKHSALIVENGTKFRKTVISEIMEAFGCSRSGAATRYNNCKKSLPVIPGLGRTSKPTKKHTGKSMLVEDNDCYTILELLRHEDAVSVGRCRSYLYQGEASEEFDSRISHKPGTTWVMVKGLGPISGDKYKLQPGEKELKRYTPEREIIVEKEVEEIDD